MIRVGSLVRSLYPPHHEGVVLARADAGIECGGEIWWRVRWEKPHEGCDAITCNAWGEKLELRSAVEHLGRLVWA